MGNHQKTGVKIHSKKILLQFQRTPPGGVVDLSTSVATVTEGVGQERKIITTSRPNFSGAQNGSVTKMFLQKLVVCASLIHAQFRGPKNATHSEL